MRIPNSGLIRKIYLDKQGDPWELIQRYITSDYTYSVIQNILTNKQITVTDWRLQKDYFEVPTK